MRFFAVVFFTMLAAVAGAASAQAPVCGQLYTVVRGDTLQKIVDAVYGPDKKYRILHRANLDTVGRDPGQLEVGTVLRIPCLDQNDEPLPFPADLVPARPTEIGGDPTAAVEPEVDATAPLTPAPETLPEDAPESPAPIVEESSPEQTAAPEVEAAPETGPTPPADAPTPAPAELTRPLRILAASGWAPFLDEGLEKGGMLAEILSAALSRVLKPEDFRIDFINDRTAHLRPLLADHVYDLSIAWFRPDCEAPETLSDENAALCDDLAWSDPLFEQVVGFYMRADDRTPKTHADLVGRRICRAEGFSTHMLDAAGVGPAAARLVRPARTETCFAMLLNGEIDVVIAETPVAGRALAKFSAFGEVRELPHLASAETLHAVTAADNPLKDAQLARVNEGLRLIRKDGTWSDIVQRALIAHARATASAR